MMMTRMFMVLLLITMTNAMRKCENVSDTLEEEIQSVVRMLSDRTGFAISVGYVDVSRSLVTHLPTLTNTLITITHNTQTIGMRTRDHSSGRIEKHSRHIVLDNYAEG